MWGEEKKKIVKKLKEKEKEKEKEIRVCIYIIQSIKEPACFLHFKNDFEKN